MSDFSLREGQLAQNVIHSTEGSVSEWVVSRVTQICLENKGGERWCRVAGGKIQVHSECARLSACQVQCGVRHECRRGQRVGAPAD